MAHVARRFPSLSKWLVPGMLLGLATALVYRGVFRGELLAGRDLALLFIPDAVYLQECLETWTLPLWLPYSRLGEPFAATLQSQAFYPLRVVPVLLFGATRGITVEHLVHVVIAVVGTALAARRLGASRVGAALAGAAFGLGPMLTQLAYQANVAGTAAWTGFLVAASLGLGRKPSLARLALLALLGGLAFLAGSPETTLWQAMLCAVVAAAAAPRRRGFALLLGGGGAFLWAFALAGLVVVPALEFASHAVAVAPGEVTDWAASGLDLLAMIWMDLNQLDPGRQRYVLFMFTGASVVALAVLAARRVRRGNPISVLVGSALALLLLSLGEHFPLADFVLGFFPFRLFRYPVKYALGAAFALSLLAGLGFDRAVALARRASPSLRTRARLVALALFGAALLLPSLSGLPLQYARGGSLALLVLAGLTFAAAGLPGTGAERARRARKALVAVCALELGAAHAAFAPIMLPEDKLSSPSRMVSAIRAAEPSWSRASVDVESGYAQDEAQVFARLASSRDMLIRKRNVEEQLPTLNGYGRPDPRRLSELLTSDGPRGLYDLAGVRWFLRMGAPPFPDLEPVPVLAASERPTEWPDLYRSKTGMPRAFVVHEAKVVEEGKARDALVDPSQPFRTTAFLELEPGEQPPELDRCEGSSAKVLSDDRMSLSLEVEACGRGLLVVTDSWYPGWEAKVDGKEAPLHLANYLVRAVPVPAGKHHVELHYRPLSFRLGLGFTLAGLLVAFGGLLVPVLRRRAAVT